MFERPRGTRDFTVAELARQRYVEQSLRRAAETFGFREILTPTFETSELFRAKSGPGILDEMFTLVDRGGRELALRPEFTASIIRFYLSDLRNEPKPLKVYTIGNCFRYEEPQRGRYREFWQWNCEIIGAPYLESDAEIIAVALAGLKQVGLRQIETRIGHIGMLRNFLKFPPERQAEILHLLDKKRMEELRTKLAQLDAQDLYDTLAGVVRLKGGPVVLDQARDLLGGAAKESIDHLAKLGEQLSLYGIRDFVYDLGVVRGLDYYTGMVFEIDSPNLGAEKQVGGGGAYALADVFGGEPALSTGFAMGMDRVVLAADKEGVEMRPKPLDVFVIPIGEAMRTKGFDVLSRLRSAGLSADIDLVGRGPSKNLDYANAVKARHCVLVGEKETSKGLVALRDMETGKQVEVGIAELVEALKGGGGSRKDSKPAKARKKSGKAA